MLGTDVDDRFQSCDILKITPDEIDGDFLRLHIVNGDIHPTRPPIKKHPQRIHRTIRKRRFHTTINTILKPRARQIHVLGGQLRRRGGFTRGRRLSGLERGDRQRGLLQRQFVRGARGAD